ncbi:P83/100 family protein [Candidatus Haliotispira prima]|uniref:P83/100 family protein n=1 Tax=Candidatus Haliotispira prima TaxID=3034016 RepID=A0ABY8MFW3_9SPIO|nr:P83/100 family protein [Candidatus Haliotispira prima]
MKKLALHSCIHFILATVLLCVTTSGLLVAQNPAEGQSGDVARNELESVEPVDFTSYVGPHDGVDSLADIIAIGTSLANLDEEGRSDYGGKYSIRHIPGDGPGGLLGADILSLSPRAGVDHVRNLRHIISGYLQARYGYEADAADTVSTFVTYYNAYFYRNAKYFGQKFNEAVNGALSAEAIGLSRNYAEWPGATEILIPLSANPIFGQESGPNLDETGKKVIATYLKDGEEDKQAAKDVRQDMLDLRREKLGEEQDALQERRTTLQRENRDAKRALEKAEATLTGTDDLKEREGAQEKEQELKEQLQDNRKNQNEVNAAEQTIAQRQENLGKDQRELSQEPPPSEDSEGGEKGEGGETGEKEGEGGENGEGSEPAVLPAGTEVVLLPVKDRLYRFYGIDSTDLQVVKRSKVNSIRSEDIVANETGYIVVAAAGFDTAEASAEEERSGGIRLLKLDTNLETDKQGDDDIHADSGVWEMNGELFAFLDNGNLGRFNMDLELQARSGEVLSPEMTPQFVESYVLVESEQSEFLLLDRTTMERKQELKP